MHAIDHCRIPLPVRISKPSDNRELTTRTSPYDLLVPHSRVVDLRALLDVFVRALPALIRRVETPAVDAAVLADSKTVI